MWRNFYSSLNIFKKLNVLQTGSGYLKDPKSAPNLQFINRITEKSVRKIFLGLTDSQTDKVLQYSPNLGVGVKYGKLHLLTSSSRMWYLFHIKNHII